MVNSLVIAGQLELHSSMNGENLHTQLQSRAPSKERVPSIHSLLICAEAPGLVFGDVHRHERHNNYQTAQEIDIVILNLPLNFSELQQKCGVTSIRKP